MNLIKFAGQGHKKDLEEILKYLKINNESWEFEEDARIMIRTMSEKWGNEYDFFISLKMWDYIKKFRDSKPF